MVSSLLVVGAAVESSPHCRPPLDRMEASDAEDPLGTPLTRVGDDPRWRAPKDWEHQWPTRGLSTAKVAERIGSTDVTRPRAFAIRMNTDSNTTRNDEPSASSADSDQPDLFDRKEIIFDVFHPMGHPIWECFRWYGGPLVHFKYWYGYKFEYPHYKVWARLTGCLFGRHDISPVWNREGEILHHVCLYCDYRPPRA